MGVTGRMSDGTVIHIDWAPNKNCWNMEAYCYGNCYGCGCCAKDKKQRYENRIKYLNEMIEEQKNFNMWDKEPEWQEIQRKNIEINIKCFKRKLQYYTRKLKELQRKE